MAKVMRDLGRVMVDVDSAGNAYVVMTPESEAIVAEVMRGLGRVMMDVDPATGKAYLVVKPATGVSFGGRLSEVLFVASGTWEVPAGVTTIYLTGCGAGSGGAGGHSADPGGGGGGGASGFCVSDMPVAVTPGATLTITIPVGGAAGGVGAAGGAGSSTDIAGLTMGTYSILGGRASSQGTATNGGAGGHLGIAAGGGATGTGAGANSTVVQNRTSGGEATFTAGGAAGGGATGPGAGEFVPVDSTFDKDVGQFFD
jgi:hypothetical protein